MAMPRPSGEAQKIAEQTIPGLNRNKIRNNGTKKKSVPKDEIELEIVSINENRGRLR